MNLILLVCLTVLALFALTPFALAEAANPRVQVETNQGKITIELYPEKAPKTVESFLQYVNNGFYDGTVFHRVIKGFMVQGGGFTADMRTKPTKPPIVNEADNGLKNLRGTVAMARTPQPHSASSQFFINTVDNDFLNHRDKTPPGWGYCVFGKVVAGMDAVDAIEKLPTGQNGMHSDVPIAAVLIIKAVVEKP